MRARCVSDGREAGKLAGATSRAPVGPSSLQLDAQSLALTMSVSQPK